MYSPVRGKDQGRAHQYQQAAQAVTQMLSQHVINETRLMESSGTA